MEKRLSGDVPGAAIFVLVFFIKNLFRSLCFVAVGAERDIRHPIWRAAHLITDNFQVNSGSTFNDQFIVDVSDDKAVLEGFHGVAENVPADGLDDVFYEFRPVGFGVLSFLWIRYNKFRKLKKR